MIIIIFLAVVFISTLVKCAVNDYQAAHDYSIVYCNSPPNQTIIDNIAHLQAQKDGYTHLYYEMEKQLNSVTDKQAITIKQRLLTLDNKIYMIDQKLIKLKEKLG